MSAATDPPVDEAELLTRARNLAGRTIGELGRTAGIVVPHDQRHAKGLVGQLVERMLGATAASKAAPDFEALGIELKTIPVDQKGAPRESTFVCTMPLLGIEDVEWEDSPVRRKLARVLWVPVEAGPGALGERRLGTAFLWSPELAEEAVLRTDWEELVGRIGAGRIEELTAHVGQALQVRPKAAHSRVRCRAPEADGAWVLTVPRGLYLRAGFTGDVVRRALGLDG